MSSDRDLSPEAPRAAEAGFGGRPVGRSSRVRLDTDAPRQIWTSPGGTPVPMPLIVDIIDIDPDGQLNWSVEATVGLRNDQPVLLAIAIQAGDHLDGGLDTLYLQEHFRWHTPVEIVTRLVPRLIDSGQDPFTADLPTDHYPEVTGPRPGYRLTREFLTDIAREYLTAERPYPQTMAANHNVTPRTIVSWIEKARKLGILEPAPAGRKSSRIAGYPPVAAAEPTGAHHLGGQTPEPRRDRRNRSH